jgi:UDPglucose 6-dehydrogenase
VIGAGYVGLVSGACLADLGHTVVVADRDAAKIAALMAGRVSIFEPGLETLAADNVAAGRLSFVPDAPLAAVNADVVMIAVGTPAGDGGETDLSFVLDAARAMAPVLKGDAIVVVKSTVPVGTGDAVEAIVKRPVVSNPEFLREGSAVADFMKPDRIVVGADDPEAGNTVAALYLRLTGRGVPLVRMARRSAELAKYAANALLATRVTFANEIADISEALGADAPDVLRAVGLDARLGPAFLRPGPGIGGSCFPKDTTSLAEQARAGGSPAVLVETVVTANEARKGTMLRKVVAAAGGVRGKTVAVLGLTFKANTDDIRESPALPLIRGLQAAGATVRAYDPRGMENARAVLGGIAFADDAYAAAKGAGAIVIVTEWAEFAALDLGRLAGLVADPVIVDLRNVIDPEAARAAGFAYHGVGRGAHPR